MFRKYVPCNNIKAAKKQGFTLSSLFRVTFLASLPQLLPITPTPPPINLVNANHFKLLTVPQLVSSA